MNRLIKIAATLAVSALLFTGCGSSLTPEEWIEKEEEMGKAYGEQLVAGKYPASWAQFGELVDFTYHDGSTTDIDEFEALFDINDTVRIRIMETYLDTASADKINGNIRVIIYSEPVGDQGATDTVKALLDKAYGKLDWTFNEAKDGMCASFQITEADYKSAFTADVSKLPHLDWENDEGVSVWDDGFQPYFDAVKEVLWAAEEQE